MIVKSIQALDADQSAKLQTSIVGRYVQRRLPPIGIIDLFLTEKCNLRCDYCFVATKTYRSSTWDTIKKAVDFLFRESRHLDKVEIVFFGGEPLLEFPLMKQAAKYAREHAMRSGETVGFSVTTNGTIMNEEIARFGREYGFNFLLSIDGGKAAHDRHRRFPNGNGTWDKVMGENFRILKSIQPWVGTRITASPDTVHTLCEDVVDLHMRGINQFIVGVDRDAEWPADRREMLKEQWHGIADFYLAQKARKAPFRIAELEEDIAGTRRRYCGTWGCAAGESRLSVSISGELYPCARFVSGFAGMKSCFLGNVDEGTTKIQERLNLMDRRVERRPKCISCDLSDYCGGGCFAANLHMRHSLFEPDDLQCFMTKLHLELLARIHSERVT